MPGPVRTMSCLDPNSLEAAAEAELRRSTAGTRLQRVCRSRLGRADSIRLDLRTWHRNTVPSAAFRQTCKIRRVGDQRSGAIPKQTMRPDARGTRHRAR